MSCDAKFCRLASSSPAFFEHIYYAIIPNAIIQDQTSCSFRAAPECCKAFQGAQNKPKRRGTVIDGEIVALDDDGRPAFNLLQNFMSESARIHYFLFDLLCFENRNLIHLLLLKRRNMLRSLIKFDTGRIFISGRVGASAEQMLSAVREQRLEGIVGKQKDSVYEPGKRRGPGSSTESTLAKSS
jgi:ATP-dependent DNA ligase